MFKKKNIRFFCVLLVLMMATPGLLNAAEGSFSDVPQNSLHFAAVEYLKSKGVISGYPDGTFQPNRPINRAEALKILLLGTSTPLETSQKNVFADVDSKDWFYFYVLRAAELKIVEGYPDGKFKPQNTINLAESLKVILLSFKAEVPESVSDDPYPDVAKSFWYAPYAQYSKTKNVIEVQDDGKLHGDRQMTRADFAEIAYRLMYLREKNLDTFPLGMDWPRFLHPSDHYSVKYPFSWLKMQAGRHAIFWKQDIGNGQMSFARIFPNSATVYMVVDENKDHLSLDNYLGKLLYDASASTQKDTVNGFPFASIKIVASGLEDFYVELPNKTILIFYTQVGAGLLKPQLDAAIRAMVGSINYNAEGGVDSTATFLSEVRKNLLVKGKGKIYLKEMTDAVVIQTDTVGIGTGPVDYYFSPLYNVTLKYERGTDTLLAMKDGKTTAF